MVLGVHTIYEVLMHGVAVQGWASTIVIIAFFNSLVLLSLLIAFIYISRINQQITRSRLAYAIDELHDE